MLKKNQLPDEEDWHIANSVQRQQTKQQFAHPPDSLSYELGSAVRRLPPLYTRLLAGSLSLALFGSIAWAAFSKVDEVAVASGELIPATQVQPTRSLTGGLLREIKVTEGQHVQQGDVLVQLDPTVIRAEIQRLEKLVKLSRETLARLEAERTGKIQAGTKLQDELLAARLQDFASRRAVAQAEANRQKDIIKASQIQLSRLQADFSYAKTKANGLRTLLRFGAVPRFDYLEAQNQAVSLQKEMAIQQQTINQAQRSYDSAKDNANRLQAERQSEILQQNDKQRQELADLEGQLSQAKEQQQFSTIRATVTGTVYNVKVAKTGSSVQAGEELLSILPDGGELSLQANVLNQDIGFIKTGMKVKVKLATFPYQEFGTLEGMVVNLSPNGVSQKEGLVFPTRIQLQQQSMRVRGQETSLVPGMQATAEIVTRQKSVLSSILDPMIEQWDGAFSRR